MKMDKGCQYGLLWMFFSVLLLIQSDGLNHRLTFGWYAINPFMLLGITLLCLAALFPLRQGLPATLRARPAALPVFFLLTFCSTFILFGKALFFDTESLWINAAQWPAFTLLFVVCIVYNLFTCFVLNSFRTSWVANGRTLLSNRQLNRHTIVLFLIQCALFSFYLIAYNPGSTGLDTYHQLAEQYGLVKYSTWHPLASTLLMKALLTVWDHFLFLTIFQILFFTAVATAFYRSFLLRGAPVQLVYAMAIFLPLLPNHGVNMTTIVKDTLFSIALLWLTWAVYGSLENNRFFNRPGFVLAYTLSLVGVALFRFNGLLTFMGMVVFFTWHWLRSGKTRREKGWLLSATAVAILCVVLFNSLIPAYLDADKNPSGTKLRTMYNGYAAMYVAEKETKLSADDRTAIEAIASPNELRTLYDPYTADPFMRSVPGFIDRLSELETPNAIRLYISALAAAPEVILGDKLNLSVVLWSATPDPFSYNNAFTTNNLPPDPVLNHYDIRPYHDDRIANPLTNVFDAVLYPSINQSGVIAALLWRSGFALLIICLALFYTWLHRSRKAWLFFPVLSNAFGVFLTMPAQEFRYAYGIVLLCPFLLVATILPTRPHRGLEPPVGTATR